MRSKVSRNQLSLPHDIKVKTA